VATIVTAQSAAPRARGVWAAMLREQVEYRELLFPIVRWDLTVRYKQTVVGLGWAVFGPLLNALVFTAVFTRVIPLRLDLPYPICAHAGPVPWTFFAAALYASTTSLTNNVALVSKV
jgi:lipopolysaccharide transport system permease protein